MASLKTVRQAAREPKCPYTEFRLRQMIAQGQCPGVRVGNRFMVNLSALIQQVDRESVVLAAQEATK